MEWKLPELGEGVQEGEIVKWMFKEGDSFKIDQTLLQIMTDNSGKIGWKGAFVRSGINYSVCS